MENKFEDRVVGAGFFSNLGVLLEEIILLFKEKREIKKEEE